ncbi:MAG: ABC transporter substrate-binding protein [Acidobacteria bacterium]|nr:ABC transporter substrate-binding protein [Acidobacteriota bacterium]
MNIYTNRSTGEFPARFKAILSISCILIFILLLQDCRSRTGSDELVMMIEKRVSTFDPRVSSDSAAERMRQLMFNGLTRKNERFDPSPDLAEKFEASADNRSFTFHLRPNVKFHNGKILTSLDVKYTFETMLASGFASDKKAELVKSIASVEVLDPLTVVFKCNDPFPGFPNAILPVGIIPEGTTAQQAKTPIGTGPFKFESYTEDQEVVLSANQDYFEGSPGFRVLRVKIVPDNSTRESELRKGSVDLAINADFDPVTVEGLQKADGIKVELVEGTNITHLGINLQDPVLKDVRVRQAIAHAIDRGAIIRDVLRGQARPANSVLPASQGAYEPAATAYDFNIEKAVKLLDEAGRVEKNGQPRMKLLLKTSTISVARKIAESMQEQLRKVGIAIEIQSLERQKLVQDMSEGNFQLYLNTLVGGNQSTDIFKFVYSSQSVPPNGQNRSRYNNPLIDKLLIESQSSDRGKQKEIFSQMQKILANDLPQIYLWYPSTIVVYRNRVTGLKLEPSGDWQIVRNVKIKG